MADTSSALQGSRSTSTSATHTSSDSPYAPHHNRDLALQKYLLLHEQHENLCNHLEQLLPLGPMGNITRADTYHPHSSVSITFPATAATSPSVSPTRTAFSSSSGQSSPYASRSSSTSRTHRRRQSMPAGSINTTARVVLGGVFGLETVPDESTLTAVAADEARLFDVNEGIKRALTELLNCEAVRADRAFRTWVQCRLMETEKELRVGRRRRSAAG